MESSLRSDARGALLEDAPLFAVDDRTERTARRTLLRRASALAEVERANTLSSGARPENSAEHSWHLALFALALAPYAEGQIAIERVVRMAVLHDLIEVECGDTPIFAAAATDQQRREREAAETLFAIPPREEGAALLALWSEFEAGESDDARFAKALDRFQPIVLNHASGGATWVPYRVDRRREVEKTRALRLGAPRLWSAAEAIFEEAMDGGWLGSPGAPPRLLAPEPRDWRAQRWLEAIDFDLAARCRFLLACDALKEREGGRFGGQRWLDALASIVLEPEGESPADLAALSGALARDLADQPIEAPPIAEIDALLDAGAAPIRVSAPPIGR